MSGIFVYAKNSALCFLKILLLEIHISLNNEKHVVGAECSHSVFFCLLTDVVGYNLHVDVHFLVVALEHTARIVVVDDGVNDIQQVGL